jgi:hypothetical protein
MGSYVTLGIGRLEIDWGKNHLGRDHSALFMRDDVRVAPYFYADDVIEEKPGFVRPLRSVKRRLEMLGYTMAACRDHYQDVLAYPDHYPEPTVTYETFARIMSRLDVTKVKLPETEDWDLGQLARAIMRDPEFTKTEPSLASLSKEEGAFFENIDPYVVLRLLAENPASLDADVIWRTEDVVEGGYVERDDLYQGVSDHDRCLVVTEGSSDGDILRESLPIVAPDLSDFFDFVDMSENYPFTGTGNVVRFCQGLARIRVHNRILVVLDNDTAGREAFQQLTKLARPSRLRVTLLPDHERCRKVRTLGPSGEGREDINGRAVAIECFLDIWSGGGPEPTVRWASYNAALDAYQGALVDKVAYTRAFFDRAKLPGSYDMSGLSALWSHLFSVCTGATVG